MKTTKILLLLIFLCSACGTKSDNGINKIDKKIKSENTQIYEAINDNDSIKTGDRIRSAGLNQNERKLYFYDKKERLKKLIKDSVETYTYEYNDFDSIRKVHLKSENFESRSYLKYNNKHFLIMRVDSVENKRMLVIDKEYNTDNKVVKTITSYPETAYTELIEKIYNSDNKLIEERIEKAGNTTSKNIYQYPNDKTVIIKNNYIDDSNYIERKRIYNKNNILIEETITPIGSERFMIVKQKKDKLGNLIEHLQLNEKGDTIGLWNYQYFYDLNDNWIQKINLKDDKAMTIIKRQIEYKD